MEHPHRPEADVTIRELTPEDKRRGFLRATQSFASSLDRWEERREKGMTDDELADALKYELGIYGGASSTDDVPGYTVQGAGLQIWLSWSFANSHTDKPTFKGAKDGNAAYVLMRPANQ